jgi:hypothetical protein
VLQEVFEPSLGLGIGFGAQIIVRHIELIIGQEVAGGLDPRLGFVGVGGVGIGF